MNATLQCIAATPALAQLLARGGHAASCRAANGDFCVYCVVERIVGALMFKGVEIGGSRPSALNPTLLSNSIRALGRQFRVGRQEDAHEFLRCLLERMHARSLRSAGVSESAPDRRAETTDIHRLCGGYFRNQVHCPECGFDSNAYEPFLDLSLEVGGGLNSLDRALRAFCTIERLDERNKWTCPSCSRAVCAEKRLTLARAPAVLTVHFKRFSFTPLATSDKNRSLLAVRAAMGGFSLPFHGFGGSAKIGSHIAFPLLLDLAPHVSEPAHAGSSLVYDLHGVLVHQGASSNSGHYFSFVKDAAGAWSKMNDEIVSRANEAEVLKQPAYMLFYSRRAVASGAAEAASASAVTEEVAAPAASARAASSALAPERVTDFEGLQWSGPKESSTAHQLTISAALTRGALSNSLYGSSTGAVNLARPAECSTVDAGRLSKRKRMAPHAHFSINSGHELLFDPFRVNSLIPRPRVWDRQAVVLRYVKPRHTIFSDVGDAAGPPSAAAAQLHAKPAPGVEAPRSLSSSAQEFIERERALAAFVARTSQTAGDVGDESDDESDAAAVDPAAGAVSFSDVMSSAGLSKAAAAKSQPLQLKLAAGSQLERVVITGQQRAGGALELGALATARPPLTSFTLSGAPLGQLGWDDSAAETQYGDALASWSAPAAAGDDDDDNARLDAGRLKKVKLRDVAGDASASAAMFQSRQR
jgi:ubiquitin C-terminal hydrolase